MWVSATPLFVLFCVVVVVAAAAAAAVVCACFDVLLFGAVCSMMCTVLMLKPG